MNTTVKVVTVGYGQSGNSSEKKGSIEIARFAIKSKRFEEQNGIVNHIIYFFEFVLKSYNFLWDNIKNFKPHLIVYEGILPGGVTALLLRKKITILSIPELVRVSGSDYRFPRRFWISRIIIKKIFTLFKKIYFVTPDLILFAIEDGLSRQNAFLAPRGVDIEIFKKSVHLAKRFRNEKQMHDKFVLLSVARCIKLKMQDVIIESLIHLTKEISNVHLFLVGDGPELQNYKNIVTQLKLDDMITFTGSLPQKELIKFYNGADLFIGAHYGSWFASNTLFEAAACGCTCLVNAKDEYLQYYNFINNEDIFLFNEGDPLDLANKIYYIYSNPEESQRIKENLYNKVCSNFNMKNLLKEFYIDKKVIY